jgi:hypothetical protein
MFKWLKAKNQPNTEFNKRSDTRTYQWEIKVNGYGKFFICHRRKNTGLLSDDCEHIRAGKSLHGREFNSVAECETAIQDYERQKELAVKKHVKYL